MNICLTCISSSLSLSHARMHTQWRLRYVVFKTMSSGRFQFMVYKEHPPSPSNEIKEIPIEEFGGIESNLKLDNEKNAFAIISTNFTDCFSVETPEEMQEWVRVLQRYLGKGGC